MLSACASHGVSVRALILLLTSFSLGEAHKAHAVGSEVVVVSNGRDAIDIAPLGAKVVLPAGAIWVRVRANELERSLGAGEFDDAGSFVEWSVELGADLKETYKVSIARGACSAQGSVAGLPSGWVAEAPVKRKALGLEWIEARACAPTDGAGLRVTVTKFMANLVVRDGPSTLAPVAPVLEALRAALEVASRPVTTPLTSEPSEPPSPSHDPSGPSRSDDRGLIFGWWSLEIPISWRDVPDDLRVRGDEAPALRVDFPGVEFGLVWSGGPLLARFAAGAAFDGIGALSGDTTLSPRFGGQRLELGLDFGFALALGEDTRLGLSAGWHGMAGPLTKNSSLALSAHLLMLIDSRQAFALRVTPVQLLASNERMLLSPLSVDLRFFTSGLGLGVELQYIGAPEADDEDIPAEGFACILRLGTGHGGHQ